MTRRHILYERVFEDFLRTAGVPYVAVDEAKRALVGDIDIKSADFIVHAPTGDNLIVDVKGKHFPYEHEGRRTYWESWVHVEDLEGLAAWEALFGENFQALIVFVYWVKNIADPHVDGDLFSTLHRYRDRDYALMAIDCTAYCRRFRSRSRRWKAVDMARADFQDALRAFDVYLHGVPPDVGGRPLNPFSERSGA